MTDRTDGLRPIAPGLRVGPFEGEAAYDGHLIRVIPCLDAHAQLRMAAGPRRAREFRYGAPEVFEKAETFTLRSFCSPFSAGQSISTEAHIVRLLKSHVAFALCRCTVQSMLCCA